MAEQKEEREVSILRDFQRASDYKRDWIDEAKTDYEYAVGKQWEDADKETLRKAGVHALTINKIQPMLFLVSGIQRQNRTDFRAFPEGEEDSLKAEIVTRLLKNALKKCRSQYKLSEQFEDGIICGEGWLEPFLDYSKDLINGAFKLKKVEPFQIFTDPDAIEYDKSDGRYICKYTADITEEQLLEIYPDAEKNLDTITNGKIDTKLINTGVSRETDDYPSFNDKSFTNFTDKTEKVYDLLEYYYKKKVKKWLVADKELGQTKLVETKQEAEEYVEKVGENVAIVIERETTEIWLAVLVGNKVIKEVKSPFYPAFESFHFIPFYAHRINTKIDDTEYMVQGIVRSLRDPQTEINKRRTQELRHLNQSANSGWLCKVGSFIDKHIVSKFGSSSAVILEWKGSHKPEKITPTPLSTAHTQLAIEATQDIKEISGINADLLSQESKTESGRAIFLRQQQGLVMLQRVLDNFSQTKRILAELLISQLTELYTVDTAVRVLGEKYLEENFSVPVDIIAARAVEKQQQGQPLSPTEQQALNTKQQYMQQKAQEFQQAQAQGQQGQPPSVESPVVDSKNELVTMVDADSVGILINQILNDADLDNYDIAVGESPSTETIKLMNSNMLLEMAEKGLPIPPDVIIDESMLTEESKAKIKQAIQQQQAAQQQIA